MLAFKPKYDCKLYEQKYLQTNIDIEAADSSDSGKDMARQQKHAFWAARQLKCQKRAEQEVAVKQIHF